MAEATATPETTEAKQPKPTYTWGVGRRKSACARVRIAPGTGKIEINGRALNDYFSGERSLENVERRVAAIVDDLGISREELPEVALRYVLSRPEVSTVIPGMRTVRNVERNMAIADGAGLPDERVAALKAHRWDVAAAR